MALSTHNSQAEFGGSFLFNPINSLPYPDHFSSDEMMMIDAARDFNRSEILPRLAEIDQQQPGLMPDLIRKAGELGFCGVDSPEQFGGLGLSKSLATRILEMLSLNGSFSVTFGITSGISQVGLTLFGNDEQRNRYLPKLTSGEWIGAYALSEPNSGSDAMSLTCKAVPDGDGFRLTGTKMWISNAQWANLFLVIAKVNGDEVSAFLVERTWDGVEVEREEHKLGLKGSSTARLVLNNVYVPGENLLHQVGKGHQVAFNALNIGRMKLAAMSLGPARDALRLGAVYARERKQFQQSISEFGLVQKKFATSAALYFIAESMTYRTSELMDQAFAQSDGSADGNRQAAQEYAVECSLSKVAATEAEAFIVDEMLQVFGGYGFTEEFAISRHYRDARVSRIYEGTNEINRFATGAKLKKLLQERPATEGDCFPSELLKKVDLSSVRDQVQLGALADLSAQVFAQKSVSARLRGRQSAVPNGLRELIVHRSNLMASAAFQELTGDGVQVPAPGKLNWSEVSDQVCNLAGPF